MKPLSTARTAGRSDWAERRFRRQPFILLFVGASSISLVSAQSGENSLSPLRLLFPPNPLRWASAGALLSSDNRPICRSYVPYGVGKSSPARFQITLAQTPQRSFQGAAVGTHATPAPNRAHSGLHAETGTFRAGWYHYPRSVSHVSETLRGRVSERQTLPLLGLGRRRF